HRAAGKLAPENTMAAFAHGRSLGLAGFECDAMLSADGVLVLSHDEALGRSVEGAGRVAEMTCRELKARDAARGFPAWRGEPVATLAEAMAWCKAGGAWMNIEAKPSAGSDAATGRAAALAAWELWKDEPAARRPLLSSFSRAALAAAREAAPGIARALLLDAPEADWLQAGAALGVSAVHMRADWIEPALVALARGRGWGVMAWVVDDAAQARALFAMGVDAVCTDRPDLLAGAVPDGR
ncbi:MAG: glycerophosphodiester phosphodiesterase, partial [Duodenibacillus sp.]|nr:glycerophosphodiester phosphodiesterase [Duodenibacillus sp.]